VRKLGQHNTGYYLQLITVGVQPDICSGFVPFRIPSVKKIEYLQNWVTGLKEMKDIAFRGTTIIWSSIH
jgi:hypothetical protein